MLKRKPSSKSNIYLPNKLSKHENTCTCTSQSILLKTNHNFNSRDQLYHELIQLFVKKLLHNKNPFKKFNDNEFKLLIHRILDFYESVINRVEYFKKVYYATQDLFLKAPFIHNMPKLRNIENHFKSILIDEILMSINKFIQRNWHSKFMDEIFNVTNLFNPTLFEPPRQQYHLDMDNIFHIQTFIQDFDHTFRMEKENFFIYFTIIHFVSKLFKEIQIILIRNVLKYGFLTNQIFPDIFYCNSGKECDFFGFSKTGCIPLQREVTIVIIQNTKKILNIIQNVVRILTINIILINVYVMAT